MDAVEKLTIAVVVFMIPVFISILMVVHWQNLAHEKFLEEHGCHLFMTADTGKLKYCGKACWHREIAYIYECRDGTRTELH